MASGKKGQRGNGRQRRLRIRSIRRDPPDLRKLAGALIALAQAQAEADAEAQHRHGTVSPASDSDDANNNRNSKGVAE